MRHLALILAAAVGATLAQANLMITEVDCDQTGTDATEFVELYDGGVGNTALLGYVLVFFNGATDTSYFSLDLDAFSTDGSGFFVLGNAAVPGVDATFANNTLQNGPDAVGLFTGDGTNWPTGTAVTTLNLLSALVYDTADADDSGLLTGLGQVTQYDEDSGGGGITNSVQYDGVSAWAVGSPTPGALNFNAIPEPGALTLAALGGISLALWRRRSAVS